MFKKTDESEWSRFSRALGGQPKGGPEETPAKEQPVDPAPLMREPAPMAPPVAQAAPRTGSVAQPYVRPSVAAPAQVDSEDVETIVGVHSSFEGTLRCASSMRIKGSAQGEIHCAKGLVIEETAQVNAQVTAASAVVAGRLEGSIICEGRLEILATGHVTGELTSGVLIIQEGAFFEGRLKMKERNPVEAPAAEATRRFPVPETVVN